MAQKESGGWDPEEVMDGLRGCVGVTIQVGNAMILNDSWNRIAQRNYNRLLKPDKQKQTAWQRRVGRCSKGIGAIGNSSDSTSCTLLVGPSVA
jgi:hypothetical protein